MTWWMDVAGIVFTCVTANHLGPVPDIERMIRRRIPIVGCVKCCTFWAVLAYMAVTAHGVIPSLAASFLASYIALWVELLEGIVDELYKKVYENIYPAPGGHAPAADHEEGGPAGAVPELRQGCKSEH